MGDTGELAAGTDFTCTHKTLAFHLSPQASWS